MRSSAVERILAVVQPGETPGGQQRRRHVMRPAGVAAGQLHARDRILAVGDRADGDAQTGEAVVWIAHQQPVGELKRILHIAVGQGRGEGAFDQFGIARIGAQSLAKIGGRRGSCRDRRRRRARRDNFPTGSRRLRTGSTTRSYLCAKAGAGGQREAQRGGDQDAGGRVAGEVGKAESGEPRGSTFFPRQRAETRLGRHDFLVDLIGQSIAAKSGGFAQMRIFDDVSPAAYMLG